MGKAAKKKRRQSTPNAGRVPDARVTASQLAEPFVSPFSGETHQVGAWVRLSAVVGLEDGRTMMHDAPNMPAFYLIEAKGHRDKAERVRLRVIRRLTPSSSGETLLPEDPSLVLDCLSGYTIAVQFSYAALEALANAAIDALAPEATVQSKRSGKTIGRDEMVARLSLPEKLDLAVPLLDSRPTIKGTETWKKFVALQRLRNDLVHVKRLGYSDDPDDPSVFGRLLAGEAKACVEDALAVVDAVRPGSLRDEARAKLTGP